MKTIMRSFGLFVLTASVLTLVSTQSAFAVTAAEMDAGADKALAELFATSPEAKALSERATGILVFPTIVKAGFLVGAQGGKGVLRSGGKTTGYYDSASASYGLQAGVQSFGYALFFMSADDLQYLHSSGGWEVGVGPNITVVDAGVARSLSTSTAKEGVYAFFFGQKGLMAGMGIQGTKITEISLQ